MKIGVDSYCYHRYFGEVYDSQTDPGTRWTTDDFVRRAIELKVDGVSLELCFFPQFDAAYLANLRATLDDAGIERVAAWGHPDGLEAGGNDAELRDMIRHIDTAVALGADVMRIVASSLMYLLTSQSHSNFNAESNNGQTPSVPPNSEFSPQPRSPA